MATGSEAQDGSFPCRLLLSNTAHFQAGGPAGAGGGATALASVRNVRVLVTGSSGFVGGWLLRHLADIGDDVVTLDDTLDITDRAALVGAVVDAAPDAICHLAAQASVGASWSDAASTFSVNTIGVVHLVDAAVACASPPRLLLVSSAEVYGRVRPDDLPLDEDRPFAPVSPYAASKAAAELVGLQAWLGRGLEVVRARPFNHTGPEQRSDFVVPSLARQVVEVNRQGGAALEAGNIEVRRDISDVRDVVRAYRLLLEHGEAGGVYNVCRGSSVAISEVARRLLAIEGLDVPIHIDPARVRAVDIPDVYGDTSRLSGQVGWSPQISLDETLADVLEYWRAKLSEPTGS
jgi:GDP-4-dehydro-6-deoxy-D-mannose reductase